MVWSCKTCVNKSCAKSKREKGILCLGYMASVGLRLIK